MKLTSPHIITALVAVAALGVTTAPASAKPTAACTSARVRLAQHQRWIEWAHAYSDQATVNFYRSLAFDDQIDVLNNC